MSSVKRKYDCCLCFDNPKIKNCLCRDKNAAREYDELMSKGFD